MPNAVLPDPAVLVLVGAAGSGKSTWAAGRYRSAEIVSSDALREVVGSGPADLDASVDAFALLDRIVAARTSRRLTTVIDTLGLDPQRRAHYLATARSSRLPAVLVIIDTPAAICRKRNADRDRPVPAPVLAQQIRAVAGLDEPETESWDLVVRVEFEGAAEERAPESAMPSSSTASGSTGDGPQVVLQVSRFPWGDQPGPWLRDLAAAAAQIGLHGLAVMDHLIQIPQVGRAWDPIPEPWVTLGFLAGTGVDLRLGTLVSPVTFRAPGIIAKTSATLATLSGGPTFCGLGAGWWSREHAAYGIDFPGDRQRLDQLETCIETVRALWAPGTRPYDGQRVTLPETTCYPRPEHPIPIIVGGSGERRTLRIVAERADGCNLPSDETRLPQRLAALRAHCVRAERDVTDLEITVLDIPVVGRDRDDVARRVERLRGRTPAAAFAARHHAGTPHAQAERYLRLAESGVRTVFCALPDLAGADDLDRLQPVLAALR